MDGQLVTTDVKDAQEAFETAKSGWDETYAEAKADLKFQHGGSQWEGADRAAREKMRRPCLEVNLLPQFVRQVTNDVRMNTPAINVSPVGGGADIETARVQKGLIRNIEYTSSAPEAYHTALEYAVKCGIGFFRLDHDFEALDGFNQQIFIRKCVNPFANYLDPNSIEDDGCDAMYSFTIDSLTEKEFKRKYPKHDPESFEGTDGSKDKVISVAEYFRIEEEEKQAALLEDGSIVEYQKGMDGVRTVRSLKKKKVYRCKVSGADILEETIFPGIYVPLVPVYGEVTWIDGKRKIKSLVTDMKDPQRMHNYWASLETQILMMQPIAPVMAEVGQTEDFADDWSNPGNASVLRYKGQNARGENISPPQRLSPPTTPMGITNARMTSAENMKQTVGMYDDSLGQRSNAVSGVAINNRKVEGEVATYHFGDNLNRSIAHGGRIAIGMIPQIYDTSRVIRIMGEEDASEEVGINGQVVEGQKRAFDLTAGQYDVRVTAGASFTTKRQEAAQYLQTLIQAQPELVSVAGDILVKNMDFPGAEALADRLRKMVPPNLLSDKEKQAAEQQVDPEKEQMQQLIQQGAQELQSLQSQVEQLQNALKNKDQAEQAGIQIDVAKLELEKEKIANDRMKIQIEAQKAQTDQYKVQSDAELKAAELQIQAQQPQQPQVPEQPEAPEIGGDIVPEEAAVEQAAAVLRAQQANATLAVLGSIAQQLNGLTAQVAQPKQVIRGEDGRVIGVQ